MGRNHNPISGDKMQIQFQVRVTKCKLELTLHNGGKDGEKYDCPDHRGGQSRLGQRGVLDATEVSLSVCLPSNNGRSRKSLEPDFGETVQCALLCGERSHKCNQCKNVR